MLLILMYHRVHGMAVSADALRTHLKYVHDHHPLVLPGDALPRGELSVCLTFDDATVDFFQIVFPLLEKLDAKAVVAVPTAYIESATLTPMSERLAAQDRVMMSGDYAVQGSPLCTWDELRTLQDSGRVRCASHSHTHVDMTHPDTDVRSELILSDKLLRDQLGCPSNTFVYPYGRARRAVQRQVRTHFPHAMRIGTAMNLGWDDNGGLLYRVDAEQFWPDGKVWTFTDTVKYRLKYLGNRIRGK
jgi:peptidoglycan/xylan/chitin deacetylase (PgdA/CDA1 family)